MHFIYQSSILYYNVYFLQTLNEIIDNPEAKAAVIISAKPGSFIAGADIGMLDSAKSAEEVRELIFPSLPLCFIPSFSVTRNLKKWSIHDPENGSELSLSFI